MTLVCNALYRTRVAENHAATDMDGLTMQFRTTLAR